MTVWWLWAAAAAAAPAGADVLDDTSYRFCHESGFDKRAAAEFCALLLEAPPEVCPGMRESCTTDVEELAPGGCAGTGSSGDGSRVPADVPEPERIGSDLFADLEWLGQVARWVMALLVAVLVAVFLRVLVQWFGTDKRRGDSTQPASVAAPPVDDGEDPLPDVPDVPSDSLLADAEEALRRGRPGDAVVLARGAALRSLGDRGALRLHRSRTDREYLRTLRFDADGEGDAEADLRIVVAAVESHVWGGEPVEVSLASRAVRAAARLVGLGLWLWVALPAQAQTPERYGARGDAALLEVFEAYGYDATWRLTPLADLGDEVDALVIDAAATTPDAEQWEAVRLWVEAGGVLLVGGDASVGFPELGEHEATNASSQDGVLRSVAAPRLRQGDVPSPRFSDGPGWVWLGGAGTPLATSSDDPDAWVVQALDLGDGVVVAVSDDRLFENGALVHPHNERFLGEILYSGQARFGWPVPSPARVQLSTRVALSNSGANNPAGAMANANLLPVVLQILALWLLAGLWRGWPFGARRDPPDEGRLAFSEHIEALGAQYHRLGASRLVLVKTAQLWLARLGPLGLQSAAERAGLPTAEARAWVAGLEQVIEEPAGQDDKTDLDRVEELWRITRSTGS